MHHRSHLNTQGAHFMRHNPTAGEALLWRVIRARQLGEAFRRQVPIGRFIVDSAAPKARLIVEVDGGVHSARRSADRARDRKLRGLGYRVLRVGDEAVRTDLSGVVAAIREALSCC